VTNDPATVETFILLVDALIARLAEATITGDDLTRFFRALARLFGTAPSSEPAHERQGLWGELFLMRQIGGISMWCPFWHSDPYKRFDLSAGCRRLEVKTTLGPARSHEFAHRQLYASGDEQIAVASLILRPDPIGLSLRTLISQAREELSGDPSLFVKLEIAIRAAAMGHPAITGPAYNEAEAMAALVWFWAHDVPRFTQPEPAGVSNTHYRVDLSTTPPIPSQDLDDWLKGWDSLGGLLDTQATTLLVP
jgi:hypothetical protein